MTYVGCRKHFVKKSLETELTISSTVLPSSFSLYPSGRGLCPTLSDTDFTLAYSPYFMIDLEGPNVWGRYRGVPDPSPSSVSLIKTCTDFFFFRHLYTYQRIHLYPESLIFTFVYWITYLKIFGSCLQNKNQESGEGLCRNYYTETKEFNLYRLGVR